MSIFRRPDYLSDVTLFLTQLKTAKPSLEAEQRQGRALLWDQTIDRQTSAEFAAARVAHKPYVYHPQA
jgi:hypothetical protein